MLDRRRKILLMQLRQQGIRDERLLKAIEAVPREYFIDEAFEHKAYANNALPIGRGQTISQPYTVARMTELLELRQESRVLEIGTGSGYQTAVLAHLVKHVFSIERIKKFQWQAKRRLHFLDLHNISTRHADGGEGWSAHGPFDAIIVTAAVPEIPPALIAQLDENGVMVLPIGREQQALTRLHRQNGEMILDALETVHFVPLLQGDLA
nr:protein-L-isoaspartate(D-aspartate) O-methyltransferase [Candidatus Steffania adelgidicola]